MFYFIYIAGTGSKGSRKTETSEIVNYGSRGVGRDVFDAVSDIYRRGRSTDRTKRLASAIVNALRAGHAPVIIANSHGAVLTANVLRMLGMKRVDLRTVRVYTLGAPRLVPVKTQYYTLADAVNVVHVDDRILPHIRRFKWWDPSRMSPDTLSTFTQNRKVYKVFMTTARIGCRDVHTCLPLLRLVIPQSIQSYM